MSARIASMGVAVFVKTPELSPVKTRLAAGGSEAEALAFYRLSCRAVSEVLRGTAGVTPYWAVAEEQGAAFWRDFPVLTQGDGGLGERMSRVYDELLARHDVAVLIGADCPQISARDFEAARAAIERGTDFVFGPASDGGFYLLAGRRPIDRALWLRVPYSVATTEAELRAELARIASVARIRERTDVDTIDDLPRLRDELAQATELTPTQSEIAGWLDRR